MHGEGAEDGETGHAVARERGGEKGGRGIGARGHEGKTRRTRGGRRGERGDREAGGVERETGDAERETGGPGRNSAPVRKDRGAGRGRGAVRRSGSLGGDRDGPRGALLGQTPWGRPQRLLCRARVSSSHWPVALKSSSVKPLCLSTLDFRAEQGSGAAEKDHMQ